MHPAVIWSWQIFFFNGGHPWQNQLISKAVAIGYGVATDCKLCDSSLRIIDALCNGLSKLARSVALSWMDNNVPNILGDALLCELAWHVLSAKSQLHNSPLKLELSNEVDSPYCNFVWVKHIVFISIGYKNVFCYRFSMLSCPLTSPPWVSF